MMSKIRLVLSFFVLFCIFLVVPCYLQAASLIDACRINPVFCGANGRSDLRIVRVHPIGSVWVDVNPSSISVSGNVWSLSNKTHIVYICPGRISNKGGFTGCSRIGTFVTNGKVRATTASGKPVVSQGNFSFRLKKLPLGQVIAINLKEFGTVIANCPDQPNANCTPNLLYSPD